MNLSALSGFSPSEAGKGVDFLNKIVAQPGVQAESKYNEMKYKALQDYMKSSSNAPAAPTQTLADLVTGAGKDDPAVSAGQAGYASLQQALSLQQEKAQLKQEQARLSILPPEEQSRMDATIQRRQSHIDDTEMKLMKDTEKYLGQNYSVLDTIKDANSFNTAKNYFTKQYESMADQAKLPPEQKQKFVQDHLEKTLGAEYNPQIIEAKKQGMVSITDQLAQKRYNAQLSMYNRQTEAILSRERLAAKSTDKQLASQDEKLVRDGLKDSTDTMERITKHKDEIRKQMQDLQKGGIPSKQTGGFLGMGKSDNPDYKNYKDTEDNLTSIDRELDTLYRKAQLNGDVARERLRQLGGIKAPEQTTEDKFKTDAGMKDYKLGKKTDQGYEVLDKDGKIVGHYQ